MKLLLLAAFAATAAAASALSLDQSQPVPPSPASLNDTQPDQVFYCDRLALNPEQRKRKEELNHTLGSLRKDTREIRDGYEFDFPPSAFQSVAEWIMLERLCCPFFNFELRLEANDAPLAMHLSGSSGVKQFIRAEFSVWFKESER